MPNALTLFKSNSTTGAAWLRAHDALSVTVQDNLVITTPNMDFVPEFHHFKDEDLQVRVDGRFSVINCFQWPQGYDQIFPYAACIPHKESFPFPHPLHWVWFTPNQDDFIPIPSDSFPVGTLAQGATYKDPESDILSQPSCSSSDPPTSGKAPGPSSSSSKSSTTSKALPQKRGKQKHQPHSLDARPAHSAQSGESRDKWKDPETPYLPPVNLHWDYAMKNVIKTQSRVYTPYIIDCRYRFPEPALLLGPKLSECLQAYLANWLACRPLWIG
ncbi:hypothetical protein K503DRAFT_804770 [Rhizopogon vinicolor AM-OR11-026]|uniref:Uncharacterized protein n=1 Tax=Rhizopogon vinicolor AM-OR11-026 TaxID=1314800 RepID=A0A1B7MK64_9AGAM|nr:hypothetical protein K503DRAFT_804770 [Rhizopogon vinicolor AM-OR11-026]